VINSNLHVHPILYFFESQIIVKILEESGQCAFLSPFGGLEAT